MVMDVLKVLSRPTLISRLISGSNLQSSKCKQILLPLINCGYVKKDGNRYVRTRKGDLKYFNGR